MEAETIEVMEETTQPKTYTLNPKVDKNRQTLLKGLPFRLFMLKDLPLALFAGLRITKLDTNHCYVTVPYGWRSQNPFQSIYFAAQAMAAEMSTGAMGMLATQNAPTKCAMLIVDMQAQFVKKANQLTTFKCEDGYKAFEAVEKACETGEGVKATLTSVGTMPDGTVVSRFTFTWSFKAKSKR